MYMMGDIAIANAQRVTFVLLKKKLGLTIFQGDSPTKWPIRFQIIPPSFSEIFREIFHLASDFEDQSDQTNQRDNFLLGLLFWWPKQPKWPHIVFPLASDFDDQSDQTNQRSRNNF